MLRREPLEPREHVVADDARVLLQLLLLEDIEHRVRRGAGHRIAAESIEVHHLAPRTRSQARRGHDAGDGVAVAHRLAERDEVRDDAIPLVTPHVGAGAAKAGLNFVRDIDPACAAYDLDGLRMNSGGSSGKPSLEKMV